LDWAITAPPERSAISKAVERIFMAPKYESNGIRNTHNRILLDFTSL